METKKTGDIKNTIIGMLLTFMIAFYMGIQHEKGEMKRVEGIARSIVQPANAAVITPTTEAPKVADTPK